MHALTSLPPPAPALGPEKKPEAPLLPPILSGPAALLWLWVLPLSILALLNIHGYWLIEGNMDADQRGYAHGFGLANLLNLATGVVLYYVARWQVREGRTVFMRRWWGGLPALVLQVGFLVGVVAGANAMIPPSVEAWIYPQSRFLFNQFAFAMLPLALGVLQLASGSFASLGKAILSGLTLVVLMPALSYVIFVAGQSSSHALPAFVFVTAMVLGTVLFLVGLTRAMLSALRARQGSATVERGAIVLFALVLPLGGLLLNVEIPFPVNFQAWEVYVLTIANAAILMGASYTHSRRPRVSIALLSATFPFSLYFFVVFLPYLPLAMLALIVFGAGFLILTPTLLFVLHLHLLYKAVRGLVVREVLWLAVGCGLILPGFFVARAVNDRTALGAALDHLYAPTVQGDVVYRSSLTRLRGAISSHRDYKAGIHYPLLSDFYSWVVFDNLSLPDEKIDRLEQVFFGKVQGDTGANSLFAGGGRTRGGSSRRLRAAPAMPRTVTVSDLALRREGAGSGTTTVTMVLTLQNAGTAMAEYVTTLPLAAGIYVNGFRLHVNGVPVPGRITEKKTALWVYEMIRDTERRDPGLLVYTAPDQLELRVFPVDPRMPSIVEIDFLVPSELPGDALAGAGRDPAAVLTSLGRARKALATSGARGAMAVGLDRLGLPAVQRAPYLHVIVDHSVSNGFEGDFAAAMRGLQQRFPEAQLGRVALAHHDVEGYVSALTPLDQLAKRAEGLPYIVTRSGGLALDLALAHGLRQHGEMELDAPRGASDGVAPRPIFVVLGATAKVQSQDLPLATAWSDLVPALEVYGYGADGTFETYLAPATVEPEPLVRAGRSQRPVAVDRPVHFAAAANGIEYWSPARSAWLPVAGVETREAKGAWPRAVDLQLMHHDAARNPGGRGVGPDELVAASRETGIMIPTTSYIVVETAAQWRMLELKERQKLGQNQQLEFVATPAPGWVWLAGGLAAWLGAQRWWRRRRVLSVARAM